MMQCLTAVVPLHSTLFESPGHDDGFQIGNSRCHQARRPGPRSASTLKDTPRPPPSNPMKQTDVSCRSPPAQPGQTPTDGTTLVDSQQQEKKKVASLTARRRTLAAWPATHPNAQPCSKQQCACAMQPHPSPSNQPCISPCTYP